MPCKVKKLFLVSLLALLSVAALAQLRGNKVQFEYGTYYQYYFENREFDYRVASPTESSTINGMALTPGVGFSFFDGGNVNHRLSLGLDIRKDMGSGRGGRYLDEVTANYDGHLSLKDGSLFEGIIGVFPRHYCEGEYGQAFFSDSTLFADRNLEGTLLKYRSEKFYAELGADWMGQKDTLRKERFMIFTSMQWKPQDWLHLGFAGTFYHYAGSFKAPGVVDNNLIEPYVRFDLARQARMQELSLKLGLMGTYQWDRKREASQTIKAGAEAIFKAKIRNLALVNTFFSGDGFQYLYENKDLGGNKYGANLYFGSRFYGFPLYDCAELAWTPRLGRSLSLELRARFHFCNEGFIGNTQTLSFIFDLDRMRHPKWGAGRIGEPKPRKTPHYLSL